MHINARYQSAGKTPAAGSDRSTSTSTFQRTTHERSQNKRAKAAEASKRCERFKAAIPSFLGVTVVDGGGQPGGVGLAAEGTEKRRAMEEYGVLNKVPALAALQQGGVGLGGRGISPLYLSVRCPMLLCRAPTCFHSPSVCCVWVSGSPAAMTVLSE